MLAAQTRYRELIMLFEREAMYETIRDSRKLQPLAEADGWEISDVLAKATEELGEFSEAVQIERGKITNKPRELDAPFHEAADVIICMMDALARLYPEKPASEIYVCVLYGLDRKRAKWVNKVQEKALKNDQTST